DVAELAVGLGSGTWLEQEERLFGVSAWLSLECYPLVFHRLRLTAPASCRKHVGPLILPIDDPNKHRSHSFARAPALSRLRRRHRAAVRLLGVRAVRLGAMRVTQLPLLPSASPPVRPSALAVLDERLRGTKFVQLTPRSVLNSPQQTGVDFWSLNPYIGCEFGCTYCYARYAHRYAVERAHDAGRLSDEEFVEFRGPHGWEAFEQRVFVKETLL